MIARGASFCRTCGGGTMWLALSMGQHPPANAFRTAADLAAPEPSFSLDAYVCADCALIQVPNQVPPGFFRHYLYVPSASETGRRHFEALAKAMDERFLGSSRRLLVDIGCNDGLFLSACAARSLCVLGVDPAENLAEVARAKGLDVVNEYFDPRVAARVRGQYGAAAVIVTTNTLNHIDDLRGFTEGVATLMADDGIFVVEVPHSADLVAKNEFDTIYHEHLSQFSVRSLVDLYATHGLDVFDVERVAMHGGSMRVFAQRRGGPHPGSSALAEWLDAERRDGLFDGPTYDAFRARVTANRDRLVAMLRSIKRSGGTIAGYGAPAKGNTLLNYCSIGRDVVDFLADKSPLKQGLFAPGSGIPIVSPEAILARQPDYLVVLAWNLFDEIALEQAEYRRRGGKLILPIPEPRIIEGSMT